MNLSLPPPLVTPALRRRSLFFKLAGIGLLLALLHIPLLLTYGVLAERKAYQMQATNEIAGIWGRRQLISGPVLAVPYVYRSVVTRSRMVAGRPVQVEETDLLPATAYFLPEKLAVSGTVEPEVRHRGIYDTVVYSTKLHLAGEFRPDAALLAAEAERVDWEKARVLFGVSDLHGVRAMSSIKTGSGKTASFESAASVSNALLPLEAQVEGAAAGAVLAFEFDASIQGSERLEISPVGKSTTASLDSPWADPSFIGSSLPMKRTVGASGFKAEWEASHFSRGFPQSWTSRLAMNADMLRKMDDASFGVTFAQPIDGYRLAERAQKYGLLFFVLVFAVFFLFEVTAGLRIHPLQYAMVGAALCLFFLGFLALSELLTTALAYTIAAGACTALVSFYAFSFLKSGGRTLVIAGGLSATYGYLYFVLQSQDYALLAGSIALFVALAVVMFCTRRINWYQFDGPETAVSGGGAKM